MTGAREIHALRDDVLTALERVRAACAEGDGQDPLDEAALLELKHRGLARARLWTYGDSGFALLHDGALDLAVAPAVRGSGFGAALAAVALDDAEAGQVEAAWSHGDHPAAARLAGRHGFTRARELWVMRRPTATALPGPDPAGAERTDGVAIRGFRPGDEDELLRVNAAAFVDHPEQGAMDAANLRERMAEDWFDPAGLLVAAEGERMLGFHWTKVHGPATGEVYVVAVAPQAQGRKLGKVLTLAGLHHLSRELSGAAEAEVILYVESDNLPARAPPRRRPSRGPGPS